ncbi:MAG: MOSC domain-containing protein [Candidatus Omnitrophota bacterium]
MKPKICSVNLSKSKGTAKTPVESARFIEGYGLKDDAHAGGDAIRQVSLLALESIKRQNDCSKIPDGTGELKPGDFGENITTFGINLLELKIGDRLKIGGEVVLEISKIGKECHRRCAIYYKTGDCVMPREGIFGKVLEGGVAAVGDQIEVLGKCLK